MCVCVGGRGWGGVGWGVGGQTSTVQPLKLLGMDKWFHPTLYWTCDYLSMLGSMLAEWPQIRHGYPFIYLTMDSLDYNQREAIFHLSILKWNLKPISNRPNWIINKKMMIHWICFHIFIPQEIDIGLIFQGTRGQCYLIHYIGFGENVFATTIVLLVSFIHTISDAITSPSLYEYYIYAI